MPLSWNEIKSRALAFSKEWENTEREEADAKPFLVEFLNIFGIRQNRIATFEHRVKKLSSTSPPGGGREGAGYIDLLWKGMLLVEMKSRGKDLDKAYQQAKDYCHGLKDYELPKIIVVSDFEKFIVFDEEGNKNEFVLKDLVKHVHLFALIAGYQKRTYKEQDPVNILAAERMGKLHDQLKAIGYTGHNLELYLVRLLFCLFADDTGIFETGIFLEWIENKTKEDGSDLAANVSLLFQTLNTPEDKRLTVLDESFAAFPYVNGKLFEENLPVAAFNSQMRKQLLDCCALDWGKISPAIFGSLFQSVMDEKARRNLGAHYTSEKNILKLIKPLFLDEFWKEYETVKSDKNKLKKLHDKISKLRFLDPACGCGNFLIIAYRELRLLELEIVTTLLKGQQVTSINDYFLIDVDQFYGIEYEEFPSQIAPVAMWLMDHQLNAMASLQFGEYYKRIPLKKSATIVQANALRIDWQSLIEPMPWEKEEPRYHYILGNPPFIGYHLRNESQTLDMGLVFHDVDGSKELDYVAAWYKKSAEYLNSYQSEEKDLPKIKCGFVSTNSLCQGEQVGIFWEDLFNRHKIKIHFAHRTFKWGNEAKGNAAVHVVIVGFSNYDVSEKLLYEYEDIKGEPHVINAKNINPYLVDAKDIFIKARKIPINNVSKIVYGNKPTDGGNFLFTDQEKINFLNEEPDSLKFIKPFISAHEYLNGKKRWCLWLKDASPTELQNLPHVLNRINNVRLNRLESKKGATRKLANFPTQFEFTSQPESEYILIPRHSSENRKYIPFGFFSKDDIAADSCSLIPNATLFEFGIISSFMHLAWIKTVCGRIKSDYRYSGTIVYNNYPWPENPTDKQKETVEKAAQAVLDARLLFLNPPPGGRGASLADLYDPNTMPPVLVKAHHALDKAVDLCYRPQPFTSEAKRIEYLFELYDKYTSGLFVKEKKVKSKK